MMRAEHPAVAHNYPSMGRRFAALMIDVVIGVCLAATLGVALIPLLEPALIALLAWAGEDLAIELSTRLILSAAAGLYFVIAWGVFGSSVGLRLVGLQVEGPDGHPPGLARAVLRYAVMLLLSPFFITAWTGFYRQDKRCMHDLAAGTTVAHRKAEAPAIAPGRWRREPAEFVSEAVEALPASVPPKKAVMVPILAALGLILVVALVSRGLSKVVLPALETASTPSFERHMKRHAETMLAIPGFAERIDGLSAEEAQQVARDLAWTGMAKLDDVTLEARATLLYEVFRVADERVCASFYRGGVTAEDLYAALDRLGPDKGDAYLDITARAVQAELQGLPVVQHTEAETLAAWEDFHAMLPAESSTLLTEISSNASPSDAEAAWALRTIYHTAVSMSGDSKRIILRDLVAP